MHGIWIISYFAAWALVIAQTFIVISLLWAIGRIQLKFAPEAGVLITDEGPYLNQKMIRFEAHDHLGNLIKTDDYAQRAWVLLILSTSCGPCDDLLSQIRTVQGRMQHPTNILIICEASIASVADVVKKHSIAVPVISDIGGQLRTSLKIERTPYGLAIDDSGYLRMKGVVNTGEQLEGLILHRGRPMSAGAQWESDNITAFDFAKP